MIHKESWYKHAQTEEQLLRLDQAVLRDPSDLVSAERLWSLLKRSGKLDVRNLYLGPEGYRSFRKHPETYMQMLARRVEAGSSDSEDEEAMWEFSRIANTLPDISRESALRTGGEKEIFSIVTKVIQRDRFGYTSIHYVAPDFIRIVDRITPQGNLRQHGFPEDLAITSDLSDVLSNIGSVLKLKSYRPPQFGSLREEGNTLTVSYFLYIYDLSGKPPPPETINKLAEWANS